MVRPKPIAERGRELALEASPGARALLAEITADPSAPLAVAVVGPGGTDKSTLLDAVDEAYRDVGVDVVRLDARRRQLFPLDAAAAVLVDGAHRLEPAVLDELHGLVDSPDSRVVVAYRPWPRSRALSELVGSLTRRRAPVVMGHLPRSAVVTRITARLGSTPPDELVELVLEQSGGLPALVDLVALAMVDTGRFDPGRPDRFRRPNRVTLSANAAERLRPQVEALDPAVRGLLEALAVGSALDADMLCALLGTDPDDLADIVEAGRATGLLTDDGELIPLIRSLVLRLMPVLRSRAMQQRLAGLQLDRGGSVLAAGRQLLGTGASGSRVAAVLEVAADEALAQSATLAADLFAGAVEAGADRRQLAARRAHAVALAGDLDQALRLTDGMLSDPAAPDRPLAIAVASTALAHRGLLDRSANLARSLPVDAVTGPALAVPALIGTGALGEARAVLESVTSVPASVTLFAEAQVLMARGMVETIVGSPTAALSQLARAAALLEPVGKTTLVPDTPAALTALVALHCGELSTADSALRRAVTGKLGGRPAQLRHLLLHGWVLMARGKLAAAHRTLDKAAHIREQMEPRDELFAAALAVGLARREDDAAALASAWGWARHCLVRHPVDLYTLRPLGELAVAAARLGEREWITPHLKEAENLLEELDGPVLWAASLRWDELHAAIVADQLPEAQRHAAVLRDVATSNAHVAALSRAAESWLAVLSGTVNVDAVQAAARSLHGFGLAWEASSLVSQAAGRIADRRAMVTLLATARFLHGSTPGAADTSLIEGEAAEPTSTVPTTGSAPVTVRVAPAPRGPAGAAHQPCHGKPLAADRTVLSDREIEVGELILAGLTYKQIGQRLFISPKTVEHHVARMRQRLGVGSRNELFSRLRSHIQADGAA